MTGSMCLPATESNAGINPWLSNSSRCAIQGIYRRREWSVQRIRRRTVCTAVLGIAV